MANQTFTLNFDAKLNVSQMKGALGQIQSTLNGLHLPDNITKNLQGTFNKLSEEVKNFEVLSGKDITGKADFTKLTNSANKIVDLFTRLKSQISDIGALSDSSLAKLFPDSTINNIQKAGKALNDYQNKIKSAEQDIASASKKVEDLNSKLAKENNKTVVDNNTYKQIGENLKQAEAEVAEYTAKLKELQEIQAREEERLGANKNKSSTYRSLIKEIEEVQQKLQAAEQQASKFAQQKASTTTFSKHATEVQKLQTELNEATTKLQNFENALAQIKSTSDGGGMQELINSISQLTGLDMSKFSADAEGVGQAIQAYLNQELEKLKTNLNDSEQALESQGNALRNNKAQVDEAGDSYKRFEDQLRDVSAVKSRIQYFFGLNNAINLVKRAIRGAVDTVKELDKAMTETAVVTNYTISDMWKQLPDYTKRANELGVTTKDAYEAATLYYQQGLNTEQTAALSTETLKMARIAGLEAADATDRMTNALRGFNMELNAMSAQRVDDVYSQLAAMSASNVDEISTAMTKVASLAHSANMEFETTAAFLAQIIETTRESAETAGTALKTVVARFSEVKKLYDMDELKGQDEEGQTIDINKVSSALRTAGIDLNKYFLGEVGLDDIFMELASKWDSLTSVQQRYIATQAAGSRQQSRFIALMQDYARTQQLVSAAYNANGASAKQFEKTQESLQSKLARLKNAWDQFLMGLANNSIIKGVVDLLTGLLNVVNNLTEVFGTGVGSILKWVAAFSAFAGVKQLFAGGGLVEKGLTTLVGNTVIGNALQKAGIIGQAPIVNPYQGPPTANGKGPAPTIIGSVGNLAKAGWGAAQKLGNRVATTGLGYKLGMSTSLIGGGIGESALGTTAAGLTGIATALAAVTAAVAAAVAIYKAWEKFSPEGQLKTAKKEAEKANKEAQKAQEDYKKLNSLQDTYKEKTEEINKALTTQDRASAIEERNQAILDAIKEDGTLAQYVITEQVGFDIVLTIDEAALVNATKEAAEASRQAQIESGFATANEQKAQSDVYENQLRQIWIRATGQRAQDVYGLELSSEEYLKQILASTSNQEDRSRAAELYSLYSGSVNSAQKQAELTYGQVLQSFNLDADLTNKLMPMLGQLFVETGKRVDTDQIANLVGMGKGSLTPLLEAWAGTGKVAELTLNDPSIDIDSDEFLTQTLGFTEDKLDEFATYLGVDTNVVKNHIRAQAKANKEIQKAQQINIYDRLLRSGAANEKYTQGGKLDNGENTTTVVDQYVEFLSKLDTGGMAAVEKVTAQAETLLGDKLGQFMTELPKLYGTSDFSAIQTLFNKIDLDKPIQAFAELNRYTDDTTSAVGRYANAIRSANAELFISSSLVKSFIASADYENITEQLSKFVEENGAITADNINELAESCEDLNILLEENVASAQALAEAFTLFESGKLAFDQITDSLLKALDAGKSFETIIAEVNQWVDNFDVGNDLKKGADHVTSILEDLRKYVDNWEFGNEPVEKIYDHLKGEGAYQAFLDSFVGDFDPAAAETQINTTIDELVGLFENQGLGAIEKLAGNLPGLESLGDGLFKWNLDEIGSTTDAIKQVADALEITEGAAESLILAWQTHIPGLRKEWNEMAFDEQVSAYANSLENTKVITEQQLSALAAATGHTVDEIKAKLAELAGQGKVEIPIIVNWQDEDGKELTGDTLYQKFANIFGTWSNTNHMQMNWGSELADAFIGDFEKGIKAYDPSKVLSYFNERGLYGSQANEMANMAIQSISGKFSKAVEIPVTYKLQDDNGNDVYKTETKTITVEADTVEGLDSAIDTALQEANYESVANAIATQDFSGLADNIAEAGEKGGERAAAAVTEAIQAQKPQVEVSVTYVPTNPEVLTGGGAAGGITVSVAKGGQVKSYASGSAANSLSPGVALTGEEGPEIVWNKDKGYAYVTGEQHPEFRNLKPGDRVFNARETRKILNGSLAKGGLIDSYAAGGWKPSSSSSKSGGGKGSGSGGKAEKDKTPEEWKNDLDWLYNLMEDIAELERDQKAIEEQYEDLLQDQTKTGGDLYRLLVKQLGNLYTQLNHQTFALEKREQEMREFMDITNDQDQYLWYNWQDRTLEIDWDAIDQITDEEQYKHVKELIDEAEEIQDKIDDADDSIMDITNQIQELENIWRDTFVDFEDRVLDAIIKSYQQIIDNYSELNDTLNNSNTQILDSLQKQISLERQIRDNTKTEEEISDEEARLAYLRRDTSGGNELAALQLERELADQRESYEDTLVDQAISRLQEDNDAAAQQRERQIEIMQAQLDYQSENGEFNAYISELLTAAMGADGELLTNSDLVTLLKEQENWDAMSDVSKQVWDEELNGTFKEVAAFLLKENAEQNGTFYTALTEAVKSVSTSIGSYSQAMVKLGNSISSAGSSGGGSSGGSGGSFGGKSSQSETVVAKNVTVQATATRGVTVPIVGGRLDPYTGNRVARYASGGLSASTGLAWLDGTPQEPEYVLNARQTDAFLKLADVLPSMMNSTSTTTSNTFGATYVNLSVNLESVSPDYDVDRMVDLVKDKLYDAGSYRNVNSLSFLR